MKICAICGTEHPSEQVRCSLCGSMLPSMEVPAPHIAAASCIQIKKCPHCDHLNNKTAVRCVRCGSFLGATERRRVKNVSRATDAVYLTVSTGEAFRLEPDMIIGREYQPEIWDVYASRAAFRLLSDEAGSFTIEDLRTHDCEKIQWNTPYHLGRKSFIITKKEG